MSINRHIGAAVRLRARRHAGHLMIVYVTHLFVGLIGAISMTGSVGVKEGRIRKTIGASFEIGGMKDWVGARLISGEAEGVSVICRDDDESLRGVGKFLSFGNG